MNEESPSPLAHAGDSQLLATLIPEDAAQNLLSTLGSCRAIAGADRHLLLASGLTKPQAARVLSAFELGRRAVCLPTAQRVQNPPDAASVFVPRMLGLQTEEVHAAYLDSRSRVIRVERLASGGQDSALFDVREIMGGALRFRAAAVVIAHNHPSGSLEVSHEDIAATRRLSDAAAVVGIQLADHLIVAGEMWRSMALAGHLPGRAAGTQTIDVTSRFYSNPHRRSL